MSYCDKCRSSVLNVCKFLAVQRVNTYSQENRLADVIEDLMKEESTSQCEQCGKSLDIQSSSDVADTTNV